MDKEIIRQYFWYSMPFIILFIFIVILFDLKAALLVYGLTGVLIGLIVFCVYMADHDVFSNNDIHKDTTKRKEG